MKNLETQRFHIYDDEKKLGIVTVKLPKRYKFLLNRLEVDWLPSEVWDRRKQ